ncbi:hypothetical protein H0N95_02865 [Candidatus Micrarchaeota archaeon]|nr:hypothetical protein [Candidatus Micrarchaeota archaeon]
MKQFEKVIILMSVLVSIIIVGYLFNIKIPIIINEKPSFEFLNQTAVKSTMANGSCFLEVNATIANTGGPAKNVIVKAEVIDIKEQAIASSLIVLGDVGKNEPMDFNTTVVALKNCSEVMRVKLGIGSFK